MKVGITLHPYGDKQPAGLEETIRRLSETLVCLNTPHTFVFFTKGKKTEPTWLKNTPHEFRCIDDKPFWLDRAHYYGKDIDVWVYHTPIMPFFHVPKKSVVIALDFSYLYSFNGGWKFWLQSRLTKLFHLRTFKLATHIVTISEFTTAEILKWFPSVQPSKITPIFAGFRDLTSVAHEAIEIPRNSYLSVGVIKPRKNQLKLVQAFLLAKQQGLIGSLVICGKGKGAYMEQIQETIAMSPYKNDVILAGYVTDGQVVSAYTKATALVFPTRLEGFGFPVLEAMSLGLPVITSNTNSVAEVAGDAAITVNPESVDEIAAAMLEMQDEEVQEKYRQKGHEQCKKYSWTETAKKLVTVIDTL